MSLTKTKKCKIFKNDFSITPVFRNYDPKTEPEEKYYNWIKYSLAKEKKKLSVPIQDDDQNDTENSSLELKPEDDGDAIFAKETKEEKIPPVESTPVKPEEEGGRGGRTRSVYKTDGYNLDFDLTETDSESVDRTEDKMVRVKEKVLAME